MIIPGVHKNVEERNSHTLQWAQDQHKHFGEMAGPTKTEYVQFAS